MVFVFIQVIEFAQVFGKTFIGIIYGIFEFFPIIVGKQIFTDFSGVKLLLNMVVDFRF